MAKMDRARVLIRGELLIFPKPTFILSEQETQSRSVSCFYYIGTYWASELPNLKLSVDVSAYESKRDARGYKLAISCHCTSYMLFTNTVKKAAPCNR